MNTTATDTGIEYVLMRNALNEQVDAQTHEGLIKSAYRFLNNTLCIQPKRI